MQWYILIIILIKYRGNAVVMFIHPALCVAQYSIQRWFYHTQNTYSLSQTGNARLKRVQNIPYIFFTWIKCDVARSFKFTSSASPFIFSRTADMHVYVYCALICLQIWKSSLFCFYAVPVFGCCCGYVHTFSVLHFMQSINTHRSRQHAIRSGLMPLLFEQIAANSIDRPHNT